MRTLFEKTSWKLFKPKSSPVAEYILVDTEHPFECPHGTVYECIKPLTPGAINKTRSVPSLITSIVPLVSLKDYIEAEEMPQQWYKAFAEYLADNRKGGFYDYQRRN